MLTVNDLEGLKSKVKNEQGVRNSIKIEVDNFVDEFGNLKTRDLLTIQNKGNRYPVKRLLTYSSILSSSKETADAIAKFYLNRFNQENFANKLEYEEKEVVLALVSRGILTTDKLKSYSNLQITNLIRSYFDEETLAKVIRAVPLILKGKKKEQKAVKKED